MIYSVLVLSLVSYVMFAYIVTYYLQLHRYEVVEMIKLNGVRLVKIISVLLAINIVSCVVYNVIQSNILGVCIHTSLIAITIILAIVIIKNNTKKNKLKFTKRVIRQLLITTCLFVGLLYINYIISNAIFIYSLIILVAILVGIGVGKILENCIANHYIKLTKIKLKQYPNLVKIGITGSYGKTSTKHILQHILSQEHVSICTPASYNTPMGICKFILSSDLDNMEYLIVEMGAVRRGDILKLCDIVRPDIGIITSIGIQHLDTFGSLDNIVNTKFELYNYIINNKGKIIINCSDANIKEYLSNYINIINVYGINIYNIDNKYIEYDNSIVKTIDNVKIIKIDKNGIKLRYCDIRTNEVVYLSTKLLGRSACINIALSVKCAMLIGMEMQSIKMAVASLDYYNNRMELRRASEGASVIFDAYNSNYNSYCEMLNTVRNFDAEYKILVTPGLIELGCRQYEINRDIASKSYDVFNEVWVVNKANRDAFSEAIVSNNCIVKYFDNLTKDMLHNIDGLGDNNLVVIENDLPDIYK